MQATIKLPKAFSLRDENEFYPVQHLMARLNPQLLVAHVTTGRHVAGGPTVIWGIVYLEGQPLSRAAVKLALKEAGFDFDHNAPIRASSLWDTEAQAVSA
jgi:hypothetical protein